MKFVDYAELLEHEPADLACLSTFNFEPDFFERRLLRAKSLAKARRIMVLMDSGQWDALMRGEAVARWINRRYLVVPVRRSRGVFHAKLNLLLAAEDIHLYCGSANLTRAGCTHNLELVNHLIFHLEDGLSREGAVSPAIRAFEFFEKSVASAEGEAARIAAGWLAEARAAYRWLSAPDRGRRGECPELMHSWDGSLWDRVTVALAGATPSRVMIVSPFFDSDAEMLHRVLTKWPRSRVELVVQQEMTQLPVEAIAPFRAHVFVEALANTSRRLHAKLIAFFVGDEVLCVAGSANFTMAALDGGNAESCLVFRTSTDVVESLFDSQLAKKRIRLEDFAPGDGKEPEPLAEEGPLLQLREALLLPGHKLHVSYAHRLPERPESLSIALRGAGETRPRASMKVPNRDAGSSDVAIPSDVLTGVHGGLAASLVAEGPDGRRESPPLWVIQEELLTYEPAGGDGGQAERIIQESGKGLPEFLDELGKSQGKAAVVEYLNRLNIPFNDGVGRGPGGRMFRLKIHDPFRPDVAPEWLLQGKGDASDLEEAIYEFVDRHEDQRLRRHAKHGNINGMENFLDILNAMVRLLYVYYTRNVVKRLQLVGRVCDYLDIATDGIETSDDSCEGYLASLKENLAGDMGYLRSTCKELNFGGYVTAALRVVQHVRFIPNQSSEFGPTPTRPSECLLPTADKTLGALSAAGVSPTKEQVADALKDLNIVPEGDITPWIEGQ